MPSCDQRRNGEGGRERETTSMDELIPLSCYTAATPLPFFSSLSPATPSPPPAIQNRLQYLLHSRPEKWIYAIFWHAPDLDGGASLPVLSWGAGHLRSSDAFGGGRADVPGHVGAAVMDIEWFYMVSLTRTFGEEDAGTAVPTRAMCSQAPVWLAGAHALHASGCARACEAQLHGVQTLVCVPAGGGVLELGSPDVIQESWALVQQVNAVLNAPDDAIIGPAEAPAMSFQPPMATGGGQSSSTDSDLVGMEKGQIVDKPAPKRSRARRRPSGQNAPIGHMEAERQRREKLNHLFCALRSVVPTVSRMDKASLLADAVSYINELRRRVSELETEHVKAKDNCSGGKNSNGSTASSVVKGGGPSKIEMEVRDFGGNETMILMQSENMEHPTARLMEAIREMEMQVQHASVSAIRETVVMQDVVVRAAAGLKRGEKLKAALLEKLEY